MQPAEALIRVSLLDSEIWRIEKRREVLQVELQQLAKTLQAESKRYNEIVAQLEGVRKKVADSSSRLEDEKRQFNERSAQISLSATGQMLKALQRENDRVTLVIEAATKEIERQQAELEAISSKAEEAAKVLAEKRAQVESRERELNVQVTDLTASQKRLEAQRLAVQPLLDPENAVHYERLRKKYADPVAELDDNSCGACNGTIPLRLTNQIKAGVPIPCPDCDRYVVVSMAISGIDSGELI